MREIERNLLLVRAWDLASSVESNADYTVGLLMGKDPENELIYIIDVMRGHWSPGDVEIKMQSTARWDGEGCQILIPQDPGGAGKFQARYLAGKLQGYTVRTEAKTGDKEHRANPFAAQCEHGFVKLVEGAWNQAFIDELCAFPNAAHDDQVDAASAAFRALVRRIT